MQVIQSIAIYAAFHLLGILIVVVAWGILLFLYKAITDTFRDMFH